MIQVCRQFNPERKKTRCDAGRHAPHDCMCSAYDPDTWEDAQATPEGAKRAEDWAAMHVRHAMTAGA